jgi:hypothetical protein
VLTPCTLKSFWLRWSIAAALFFGSILTVPRWWCGIEGDQWFAGNLEQVISLAREVSATIDRGVSSQEFTSDSSLFRHEWQFGTYQMAALGLLQVCMEHPQLRDEFLPVAERAIDYLLSKEVRAFDAKSWHEDPIASLDGANGHAAYLGYTNLVLALHRRVAPKSRFAELNDKISNALARRLRNSPAGILQTYPNETYPVDNSSVLGSLLLHQKYFGGDHADVTGPMLQRFQKNWLDEKSGLLFQAVDGRNGEAFDDPRASGTGLAAYFLSFGEREVAGLLLHSLKNECAGSLAGFGFVREYPSGVEGQGDIDSGPVICGISPSATGFTLASSRAFKDRKLYVQLYRTAHLTGAPVSSGKRRQFVTGGPIGNAIMLAMLTAQPPPP